MAAYSLMTLALSPPVYCQNEETRVDRRITCGWPLISWNIGLGLWSTNHIISDANAHGDMLQDLVLTYREGVGNIALLLFRHFPHAVAHMVTDSPV